jgi:hypothetical protein
MPEDQVVEAGRSGAVLGRIDLLVRAVHADAQHAHQHAAPAGDLVERGARRLAQVDRVGLSGNDRNGFHGVSFSAYWPLC